VPYPPPTPPTRVRWRWLIGGLALLAASCGGGGGDSSPTTEASTPASTAPSSTTSAPASTTTTEPPQQLTSNAKLSTAGLGPVRVGMTVEEGERVSGVDLVPDDFGDEQCRYYSPDRGPDGVLFMVSEGEIVRVDVDSGPITTLSGYGVGSTKQAILDAFGERIAVGPHAYTDGEYLVYVPVDEVDADKRVIWETDNAGVVVSMRAGRVPFVEYVEGCA
jgi:hypothetical protein